MSDGVNVDFGLLKSPDYVGDYTNAFAVGRALTGRQSAANAFGRGAAPAIPDAAGRIDVLASLGLGLKGYGYGERRALLAHLAPDLASYGLPPRETLAFDPTDANLDQFVAQVRGLGVAAPPAGG